MSAPRFDALVAVGDNLIIDTAALGPGRGAASLLYRNRDAEWPDWKARDVVTRDPGVRLLALAQDGATAAATLNQQMKRVPAVDEPVLVLISAGSKDLAAHLAGSPGSAVADADALYDALADIIVALGRQLADPVFFLANLPNPAEGDAPPLLTEFNAAIAEAARDQGATLIDVFSHFTGHGANSADPWLTPALDPTPQGASEIRRLFWQALQEE